MDLTWQGRQLSSITRDDSFTIEYGYDADGIRKYKEYYDWDTGETTRHEYLLNGTQIIKETVYTGMSTLTEAYTLIYLYDENASPIGFKYREPSYAANVYKAFFFEKNLQGDIIAIYNESGVKIGTYTYDAWGNFTVTVSSSVTTLESLIVREYNPIRYRGYYYDIETEWYYLQSRYYNPEWGRFINADGYVSTGTGILGYNMFAYCNNNPIMFVDTAGQVPITFLVLTVLVLSTALLSSCDGFVLEPGSEFDSKKAADDKARQEATEETFGDFHDALNHSYDIVYKSGVAPEIEYGATIYIHKDEELFLVHGPYDSDRSYTVAYKHPDKLDPLWIPIAMVHYHPGDAYHFTLSGGDYYSVAKKEQILVYGINVDKYTDKIIHYFKEPYLNYEYNWNEVYYD